MCSSLLLIASVVFFTLTLPGPTEQRTIAAVQATTTTRSTATTTTPPTSTVKIQTSDNTPPVVYSMDPLFGPLVGSTKIVLQGIRMNNTIARIYFEDINNVAVLQNSSVYENLTLLSPSANVTGTVSVIVVAKENSAIVANFSFEYRLNPRVLNFSAASQLLTTGGSMLTVIGERLDSVAYPQVNATVVMLQPGRPDEANSYYHNCSSPVADGPTTQTMTCLLPDLNLGPNFTRKLQEDQMSGRPTSMSQYGSIAMLNGPNQTVALVYLGLVLDGDLSYDNFSDPKSGLNPTTLYFIPPPIINCSTDVLPFRPYIDDNIAVTGMHLKAACDFQVDCHINIGRNAPCDKLSKTDNKFTCHPPVSQPPLDPNDTFCHQEHPDAFTVIITVGFYKYYYRCLEYTPYVNIPLIVGLAVGIGAPLLILFVILIVACLWNRRRKKKQQLRDDDDHRNLPRAAAVVELQVNRHSDDQSDSSGDHDDRIPGTESEDGSNGLSRSRRIGFRRVDRSNSPSGVSPPAGSGHYDDVIPVDDGSSWRNDVQRTSVSSQDYPRFPDDVRAEDIYNRRVSYLSYSPQQIVYRASRPGTLYPPSPVEDSEELQANSGVPDSNRSSVFSPPWKTRFRGTSSLARGSSSLKEIAEVEVDPRTAESIVDCLPNDADYDGRISFQDDWVTA